MLKNKKILLGIILVLIIMLLLIGISINNKNIIQKQVKEAEKLAEANQDNSYITTAEHLAEVNASVAKLTEFKSAIANYISEAGGAKPETTADVSTFGESIKGIVKEVTKDATANAEDITEGKTAYVNGNKITGNAKNENKSTIVKVALSTEGRGSYTINVATFITNNNIDIDYTKLTNNNFGYETNGVTATTIGYTASPSYSYDASTGILSINNPYITGNQGVFANGIPYLYYVTN